MSDLDAKPPGPFRAAMFQLVPYILDSMWRWREFRANRLGKVSFDPPHDLKLRSPVLSGAYLMFALVSAFLILGPTGDALCSSSSFEFARQSRQAFGALLILAAALFAQRLWNSISLYLARQAEKDADAVCAHDEKRREQRAALNEAMKRFASRGIVKAARVVMSRPMEQNFGNIARFMKAALFLGFRAQAALYLALFMLMIGAALVAAPIAATGVGFLLGEFDPMSCAQLKHRGPITAQFVALGLTWVAGFFLWTRLGASRLFPLLLSVMALWAVMIGVLWVFFMPEEPSEALGGFYPHIYIFIVGALLAVALAARGLAWLMFRRYPDHAATALRKTLCCHDLIRIDRNPPNVSGLRLAAALINGVTSHPLHFLLMPAFVAFVSPTDWLYPLTGVFAVVSIVLVMYGSLSQRWAQMLVYVERWYLVGTPLVLSVLVIAVAIARIFDVQYVSTVIDATPAGVLFVFVVMTYAALWLFESFVNRWMAEQILRVLSSRSEAARGYVRCEFESTKPDLHARPKGRYLAIHGAGRFLAQGWQAHPNAVPPERPREHAFATYGMLELIRVLSHSVPGEEGKESGTELAHDMNRRVRLYFTTVNALLIAALLGLWVWHLDWSRPMVVQHMVRAEAIKPELDTGVTADPLAQRLISQSAAGRPSLVVAASGGGTRAAVYTAVALEGMAGLGRSQDVVLLSGVSGGGVSAAVFASRFEELAGADPAAESPAIPGPWRRYVRDISQPFIQDVLEGIGEMRIAGKYSLGSLLAESLERRAFAGEVKLFAQVPAPGLILNTSISGHPYNDSGVLAGRVAAPRDDGNCVEKTRPYANLAGGRLIFTNLRNVSGFPERSADAPDMFLPYRIVNDGSVTLASASALTANFPPVFSNARVRLITQEVQGCEGLSYFVTDGGATENLGLVSALYALRGTLARIPEEVKLSDLHVLAFEASAIDYDYSDDRGIGAATGGSKERINAGLTQLLLRELDGLLAARGASLQVHYLPLPVAFRSRGGFGTHWMFARNVRVTNPHLAEAPSLWDQVLDTTGQREHVNLDRDEVLTTWRALFDPDEPPCPRAARYHADFLASAPAGWTADVQRVARWICGFDDTRAHQAPRPDYQVDAWIRVIATLRETR
jgi:hypothetical protein